MSKTALSAGLLGQTKVDIDAFVDAMQGLQMKSEKEKERNGHSVPQKVQTVQAG
jgi:hypothetical protein